MAFFALLFFALSAHAGSFTEEAVIRGQPAPQSGPAALSTVRLAIHLQKNGQDSGALCSGTLIAPDLVLTAAHCISHFGAGVRLKRIDVYLIGGEKITAHSWRPHPQYTEFKDDENEERTLHDIALLRLSARSAQAQAAKLPGQLMITGAEAPMLLAGFGKTDPGGSAGDVLYQGNTTGKMRVIRSGNLPTDKQIEMSGAQNCDGDSGGPLYLASSDGPLTVVGVSSTVREGCQSGGWAISVADKLQWLRATARSLGGYLP